MKENPKLKDAYALSSTDEVKQLYRTWAHSYDAGFGDAQGYRLPYAVALAFVAAGGQGPVLDVGAGTGLLAEQLVQMGVGPIDALDLSEEMLGVADMKGIYERLIAADVTKPIAINRVYKGIVSAGTFTFGHVGPEAISNLLNVAEQGAVFALSVNLQHYEASGFGNAMDGYADRISNFHAVDVRIYDDRADARHRNDLARIITFQKA